jgi:addiction module HigA family antidote
VEIIALNKVGVGILRGLEQALAYEQGTADKSTYVVHEAKELMAIKRKARNLIPPLHPGEFLREDFLIPLGMTAQMLAREIKVAERRVVAIVKERQGLDGDLCMRLARCFRMTPEFWMNMQKGYELETARRNWPKICKEVPMHPTNRRTGELKAQKISA